MTDPPSLTRIRFDGQVAIVTGAGRGLGAAYARLLADRGAAVVLHDAGVAADGSGADPTVADGVARDILSRGGNACGLPPNLAPGAGCRHLVPVVTARCGRLYSLEASPTLRS